MKKISALVTALVLGASSAAMAAPGFHSYGPENRDPIQRPFRPAVQSWVTLASSGSLSRGRDSINVSTTARFSKLKLEAAGRGSLFIDKLVITFANGQRQVVQIDKSIGSRTGATVIDLDGRSRQIAKVTVMGQAGRGGGRGGGSYTLAAL